VAFYAPRRKTKPAEIEEVGELNIVPYLDILMNLIIFMLLSVTGLATYGVLNVGAPSYGAGAGSGGDDQPKLLLAVLVGKSGIYVTSQNAKVKFDESGKLVDNPEGTPTIPAKGDGTFDLDKLTQAMVQVKSTVPSKTDIIISAEADIPYESLIAVMDAVRETSGAQKKLLFPDVVLGAP
jgi:biopolymer transport protein ExbD